MPSKKCSGYAIPHGHAVAAGLAVMARASERLGWAEPGCPRASRRVWRKNGLPTGTDYPAEALAKAALADKKRSGDSITIVVPRGHRRLRAEKDPSDGASAHHRRRTGG